MTFEDAKNRIRSRIREPGDSDVADGLRIALVILEEEDDTKLQILEEEGDTKTHPETDVHITTIGRDLMAAGGLYVTGTTSVYMNGISTRLYRRLESLVKDEGKKPDPAEEEIIKPALPMSDQLEVLLTFVEPHARATMSRRKVEQLLSHRNEESGVSWLTFPLTIIKDPNSLGKKWFEALMRREPEPDCENTAASEEEKSADIPTCDDMQKRYPDGPLGRESEADMNPVEYLAIGGDPKRIPLAINKLADRVNELLRLQKTDRIAMLTRISMLKSKILAESVSPSTKEESDKPGVEDYTDTDRDLLDWLDHGLKSLREKG